MYIYPGSGKLKFTVVGICYSTGRRSSTNTELPTKEPLASDTFLVTFYLLRFCSADAYPQKNRANRS